ncbi:MAG TPA: aminodeoxychorismate synthase component I [Methylovirgula sp.]|nr:aminodeoxychorismate synthase component I [Methylovirgula sp.]
MLAREDGISRIEIAWREPIEVAKRLTDRPGFAFLDSALFHPKLGRYSYIGIEPFGTFTAAQGLALWNGVPMWHPPLEALRDLLARFRLESDPALPPFQGGAIGAVPYEFGWELDGLASPNHRIEQEEPFHLGFYDLVFAFDLAQRRTFILASGFPEEGERRGARAKARLEQACALIERAPFPNAPQAPIKGWTSNFTRATYRTAIERVQDHIFRGDIYQANIAQRFLADLPEDFSSFSFYERLRATNPAPFAAYLSCGETIIASSSPELLLRKRGAAVETRPIKGTTKRAEDVLEDLWRAETLVNSEKDRAENIMIVDLLRNDLSRVCRPFSVEVPVLCGRETYANVHHLVSVVTGMLSPGKDACDLIGATFPGGSITGAPKRRSMEIIDAIERAPRGYYCGSILYLGFDGTMDMNIAIRTAILKDGQASLHAGGGITCLSDWAAEYAETEAKVKRLFDAFAGAKELEEAQ